MTTQSAIDVLINCIRADVRAEFLAALEGKPPVRKAREERKPVAAERERAWGKKRHPKDIERTANFLYQAIHGFPGERIEQIAKRMGKPTKDLKLPVKKLIAAKRIRTVGHKRARRYYPRSS